MATDTLTLRRTLAARDAALLAYQPGDSLAAATVTRASTAAYHDALDDTLLAYRAGGSLADATAARASVAIQHGAA